MFAFVPLYFSAVYSTPSSYSTGFVLEYFKSESSTTTLLNVLTMLGYNQVGPGSLSYPWIGSLPLISIFALFLIIMVFLRIIVKGIEKSTVLLVIVAFLTVFFSTGSNPPFGYINERLVLLKGPFLFLINSYYFTMQYYVLFICVMLFYILEDIFDFGKEYLRWHGAKHFLVLLIRRERVRAIYLTLIVLFLVFTVLITPFASNQVYQTHGDYTDEININNGLFGLDHYLESGYKSPDYLSILLPLSSFPDRTNLEYNNSTFADSTGLIKSVDPYPLIWNDNSYLASTIENYFSTGNFNNMADVLGYLHVKYIIFTYSYAPFQYMEQSPDGGYYNMTEIFSALTHQLGTPLKFGSYYLFIDSNVTPLADVVTNPYVLNVNLGEYLNFLGTTNVSSLPSNFSSGLQSAILSDSTDIHSNAALYKYNGGTENISYNSSGIAFFANNGTKIVMNSAYYSNENGYAIIHPKIIGNLSSLNYTTNMISVNGSLYNNHPRQQGYVRFNGSFHTLDKFVVTFTPNFTNVGQEVYFSFAIGNDSGNIYMLYQKGSVDFGYYFFFPNLGHYAWGSLNIGTEVNNHTMFLSLISQPGDLLEGNLSVPTFHLSFPFKAYYGKNNFINDPGYQNDYFPSVYNIPSNYTFSIAASEGLVLTVNSMEAYSVPNIKYIFEGNLTAHSEVSSVNISLNIFGNFYLNNLKINSQCDSYIYLFSPPSASDWEVLYGNKTYIMFQPNNYSDVVLLKASGNSFNGNVEIKYNSFDPYFVVLGISEFTVLVVILLVQTILCYIKKFRVGKHDYRPFR